MWDPDFPMEKWKFPAFPIYCSPLVSTKYCSCGREALGSDMKRVCSRRKNRIQTCIYTSSFSAKHHSNLRKLGAVVSTSFSSHYRPPNLLVPNDLLTLPPHTQNFRGFSMLLMEEKVGSSLSAKSMDGSINVTVITMWSFSLL